MMQDPGYPLVVCFGEVLWDKLPRGKKIGGAPLNAAYHLNKLGIRAALVSRVGNDDYGDDIKKFVLKNGLQGSVLQTDTVHPTGVVEVTIGPGREITYDIVEHAAWDFIAYDHAVEELARHAGYLVYGSLITRNAVSEDTLFRLLKSPLTKVLDVNLRSPFYTKDILQRLVMQADIIKMNEAELQWIAGWFDLPGNDGEKMKALSDVSGAGIVLVTYGSKGASLLHDHEIIFEPGEKIKVADTVGSGDAFLAGFLSKYISSGSLQASLRQANTMGALVAQRSGGCPDYEIGEV